MRLHRLAPVALSFVLLALPGCQSGGSGQVEGAVRSDGFPAPSQYTVYQTAWQVLREQGMTVDDDNSSPQNGVLVTHWRSSMSPFSRDGYRDRATVRIFPVTGRAGYFRTETNVVRQINADMRDPGNPMAADWSDDTRNVEMEGLINRRIEMFFLPNDVSDVWRRQHGMEPGESPRIVEPPPPAEADSPFDFLAPR